MGEHEISEDAIMWAFEFVKRDMMDKITLTAANTSQDKGDALISKITTMMDEKHGVSMATLKNKLKTYGPEAIQKAIEHMAVKGIIVAREHKPTRGPVTVKYYRKS
jgi:hypothetical protein